MNEPKRIAVDAMGGDRAPQDVVRGAVQAASSVDAIIHLVGRRTEISHLLPSPLPRNIEIHNATSAIGMEEKPLTAIKQKPDASINVCMKLLATGAVDAVVSAGNSGATIGSGIVHVKRLPSVHRPALLTTIRIPNNKQLVLLDIGANVQTEAKQLVQFARMGSTYARCILGINEPTTALLNNGTEDYKGTPVTTNAHEKLKRSLRGYQGFIEGFDLFTGKVDVVVCDGFVGNVTLKSIEGLTATLLREASDPKLEQLFTSQPATGAMLVGLRKPVYICHGRADDRAIATSIARAAADNGQELAKQVTKVITNPFKDFFRRSALRS